MRRASLEKGLVNRRVRQRITHSFINSEMNIPAWAFELKSQAGLYRKKRPLGCPIGCGMCTGHKRRKGGGNKASAKTRQELLANG